MSGRVFLDTNIFVYELEVSEARKSARATELIRTGIRTGQGVVSYQVVQEFFSVAFTKFASVISTDQAEPYFRTTFMPLLAVHSSPRLMLEAIRITSRHRLAWYDSLIVAAAIEAGCEILYSEDFQTGRKLEGLRIENPFIT